jgi:large subunit ribosomal protein L10
MVNEKKKELVLKTIEAIQKYPIVGVVNMENLPAQQLQKMRAMLRTKGVKIVMLRRKLITLALNEASKAGKKNIEQLIEKMKTMPALIFTNDNPFTLYGTIQKNKSEAPAKAGQTLPKDVVVPAGATNFAPGPIISELAAVGIKTKVDNGKLTIIEDTTVAKDGDVVSPKLAETLKRLDIKPMEIGLDLVAVWENGLVFNAKELHIDEAEYIDNLTQAAKWAMNLAMESGYTTKETVELLLQKGHREAKAVAIEAAVINDDTRDDILAKSEREAQSLKTEVKL